MQRNINEKILTISVAAYNAEPYLDRCLAKFSQATLLQSVDILIVNDGSTDRTAEIAGQYVSRYPDSFTLINKKNGGHGSTINASIGAAKGKYYKIVDADDWIEPEILDRFVRDLCHSTEDLIVNDYRMVTPDGKVTRRSCLQNGVIDLDIHSITIKTAAVRQMGPVIDEHSFYVDTELALFPMLYVETVKTLDYPVYSYLVGRKGQSVELHQMAEQKDQLFRVITRVTEFYQQHRDEFPGDSDTLVKERLNSVLAVLYIALLHDDSKEFLVRYDQWLKNTDRELYDQVVCKNRSKSMYFIRLMRKTGFTFCRPLQKLIFRNS